MCGVVAVAVKSLGLVHCGWWNICAVSRFFVFSVFFFCCKCALYVDPLARYARTVVFEGAAGRVARMA